MVEPAKWPGIAEAIAQRIRDGVWPVGTRLPAGRELAKEVGVAEKTSRHAIRHLAELGYVRVIRNTGVDVIAVPPKPLPDLLPAPDPVRELTRRVDELARRLDEHERRRHDG